VRDGSAECSKMEGKGWLRTNRGVGWNMRPESRWKKLRLRRSIKLSGHMKRRTFTHLGERRGGTNLTSEENVWGTKECRPGKGSPSLGGNSKQMRRGVGVAQKKKGAVHAERQGDGVGLCLRQELEGKHGFQKRRGSRGKPGRATLKVSAP